MYLGPRPAPGSMLKKNSSPKKAKNSNWRNEREGMDSKHVQNIRDCPCCIPGCKAQRAGQAHHLKDVKDERGMSVRSTDKYCVPPCAFHHDEIERAGTKNEKAWFAERGIDVTALAHALWQARGNLEKMIAIVNTHKQIGGKNAAREGR